MMNSRRRIGSEDLFGKETRSKMLLSYFSKGGVLLFADILCVKAACMKPAPRRRVNGAGNVARENDPFLFPSGIRHWRCR
jgi:hypothetical protein